MKKIKFPKLVIDEAKALKKHATKKELNNLDFNTFFPTNNKSCIYGQLTNNCFSERASELIKKSARRVYNSGEVDLVFISRKHLNGTPKNKDRFRYWSPIEVFVAKRNHKANERLIQFLKGEIKNL